MLGENRMSWLCLLSAACCSVAANLSIRAAGLNVGAGILSIAFLARFALGAGLAMIGLFFYQAALAVLPLSMAYPIMVGIVMASGTAIAVVFLGDPFSLRMAFGMILVFAGVALLSTPHPIAG